MHPVTGAERVLYLPDGFRLSRGWATRAVLPVAVEAAASTLALESRQVRVFGKVYDMPRLTAWYGEASYTYGGQTHAPATMPAWLEALRREVEVETGARYNSVLANYYRDGSDSIAWHSDDEDELGLEPTIASVSFGATRPFHVRRRTTPRNPKWIVDLEHGDLLVMSGRSQLDFEHSLPKLPPGQRTASSPGSGPRLNLTFRWIHT